MADRDEAIDANSEEMRSAWSEDAKGSRFTSPVDGLYRFGPVHLTTEWPANGDGDTVTEIQWDSEPES